MLLFPYLGIFHPIEFISSAIFLYSFISSLNTTNIVCLSYILYYIVNTVLFHSNYLFPSSMSAFALNSVCILVPKFEFQYFRIVLKNVERYQEKTREFHLQCFFIPWRKLQFIHYVIIHFNFNIILWGGFVLPVSEKKGHPHKKTTTLPCAYCENVLCSTLFFHVTFLCSSQWKNRPVCEFLTKVCDEEENSILLWWKTKMIMVSPVILWNMIDESWWCSR